MKSGRHLYLMHLVFTKPLDFAEYFTVSSHIGLFLPGSVITIASNTTTNPLAPVDEPTPARGVLIGTVRADSAQAVRDALTTRLLNLPVEELRLTPIRPRKDAST